jgi:hypothetical protein
MKIGQTLVKGNPTLILVKIVTAVAQFVDAFGPKAHNFPDSFRIEYFLDLNFFMAMKNTTKIFSIQD